MLRPILSIVSSLIKFNDRKEKFCQLRFYRLLTNSRYWTLVERVKDQFVFFRWRGQFQYLGH